MWKVALLLVALMVAGHFAVRYLRTNPLSPTLEGGQLVVETSEHVVRFALDGPVEGTYLVAKLQSDDFGDAPVNATFSAVGFAATRQYLSAHPENSGYGSISEIQIANFAEPIALIAANRIAYGELRGLVDLYQSRVEEHGKWLCLTVTGEALGVDSAESSVSGADATSLFVKRADSTRLLMAKHLQVDDCAELLSAG
jgi:hypothetical protein